MAEVNMPQLGETVTEGTITRWFKEVGEAVEADEVLFEVSTDKVDSEVPSPVAGVLTEILVPEGDTVEVGEPIAVVSEDGEATPPPAEPEGDDGEGEATPPPAEPDGDHERAPAEAAAPSTAPGASADRAASPSSGSSSGAPATAAPATAAPAAAGGPVLSPLVRRLISDHGLDPAGISGTGVGGRITRADVERVIASRGPVADDAVGSGAEAAPPSGGGERPRVATPPTLTRRPGQTETRVPLSNIRRRTGDHMVASKATSAHTATGIEVDYENVERVRRAHRERFRNEEGFGLTYLPFISRAVVDAIEDFPHMNASMGDGELIVHHEVNLAVAVDLDYEGLLAPVVRNADAKRLRAIAREVQDLARRARTKQLSADDITGGTFTLTNAGSFGTLFQIPVISQPQVAILSTDGVTRKPVVVTGPDGSEAIAIHSVGVLAMSWDHRAFDGAYAAAFLARIREILETRDWEAEL